MPEPGQRPDDEEIQKCARSSLPVAAERDIYIVAEESAERHMPPPPELRGRAGYVGIVEVFEIVQPDHLPHADGHVGIGGKIEIDLERIRDHADPERKRRLIGKRREIIRKLRRRTDGGVCEQQRIGKRAAGVREHRFLCKANGKARAAAGTIGRLIAVMEELFRDGLVPDDGSGDALVEERSIEQHMPVFILRFGVTAVHIHNIAQKLERIERNAERQRDTLHERRHVSKDRADHARILEKADQTEIHDACERNPEFGVFLFPSRSLYTQGKIPVKKRHRHQQQHIHRLAPRIEDQRKDEQADVLCTQAATKRVHRQTQRKKRIEKYQAGKHHTECTFAAKIQV